MSDQENNTSSGPVLFFAVFFCVLLAAGFFFVSWRNNERSQELAAQLDTLAQQLKTARTELAERRFQITQLQIENADALERLSAESTQGRDLRARLQDLEVQVSNTPKGLELSILGDLTFSSGSDQVTSDGLTLLGKVAAAIEKNYPDNDILVEGHTDNTPITRSRPRWPDNRSLGGARAERVRDFLIGPGRLDSSRVAAVSYGDARPVAGNTTEPGRRANRRAVIVILPKELAVAGTARRTVPLDGQQADTDTTPAIPMLTPGMPPLAETKM